MRALLFLLAASAASAQTAELTFSLQGSWRGLEEWEVSGCPGKAIAAPLYYQIAARRGVYHVARERAANILSKRTPWGIVAQVGGGTSQAVVGLGATKLVSLSAGITTAFAIGAPAIPVLVAILEKQVPLVDQSADGDLMVSTTGCGHAIFYSQPSLVKGFIDKLEVAP